MTVTSDTPDTRKRLVTTEEAAKYMQVCARTVRRRIDDGTFTGYRVGPRLIRLDMNEIELYLSGQELEPESDENV